MTSLTSYQRHQYLLVPPTVPSSPCLAEGTDPSVSACSAPWAV